MKYKLHILTMIAIAYLSIGSCTQDIIEKNISGQSIQLMAPANGLNTSVATQTFWWSTVNGAEQYQLEIVQGTFNYAIKLILDTIVASNKFTYTLYPGSYQWRVQAANNGYSTQFATYSLTIDTNTNMSAQTIVLVYPSNNFWSNKIANTFKWDSISGATNYRLQVIDQSSLNIIIDTTVKKEPLTLSIGDGKYTWQVRAQNASSYSPYASYTFGVDTTTPSTPVLLTPKNDSATSSTYFTLTWSVNSGSLSPVMDSLYIYSNAALTAIIKDTLTSLTSFSDTLTAGTYYWRVRAVDAAGNKSAYSSSFSFTTP